MGKRRNITNVLHKRAIFGNCKRLFRAQRHLEEYMEAKLETGSLTNKKYSTPSNSRSTFVIAVSPDRTRIASTHGDHTIKIFRCFDGVLLHTLTGHPRSPWCLAFHPTNSDILASGCLGKQVCLWDLKSSATEMHTTLSSTVVASLAFHPFADILLIASGNKIRFWRWKEGDIIHVIETGIVQESIRVIRFHPRGHWLMTATINASSTPESDPTYLNVSTIGDPITGRQMVQTISCVTVDGRGRQANAQRAAVNTTGPSQTQANQDEGAPNQQRDQSTSRERGNSEISSRNSNDVTTAQNTITTSRSSQARADATRPYATQRLPSWLHAGGVRSNSESSHSEGTTTEDRSGFTSESEENSLWRIYDNPVPLAEVDFIGSVRENYDLANRNDDTTPSFSRVSLSRPQVGTETRGNDVSGLERVTRQTSSTDSREGSGTRTRVRVSSHIVLPDYESSGSASPVQPESISPARETNRRPRLSSRTWNTDIRDRSESIDIRVRRQGLRNSGISVYSTLAVVPLERTTSTPATSIHSGSVYETEARSIATATAQTLHHVHTALVIAGQDFDFPDQAVETAMNRAIAGAYAGLGEAAVASNIISTTYRIQLWDSEDLPNVKTFDASVGIIVPSCKIHNDNSVDISQDGRYLAAFVASESGFPASGHLCLFDLSRENFGQCVLKRAYGPNAVSVSISPLNKYLLVGLASRRLGVHQANRTLIADVIEIQHEDQKAENVQRKKPVRTIAHDINRRPTSSISANVAIFHPTPGGGILYGTNTGLVQHYSFRNEDIWLESSTASRKLFA